MSKLTITLIGTASAFALAVLSAAPGVAAPVPLSKFIYAGGATFPDKAYRDIMNCYGAHSGGDTEVGLTSHTCSTGDAGFTNPYTTEVQVLYAGVGSGNGRRSLRNHVAGDPNGLTNGGRAPDNVPVPSTADDGPRFGTATGPAWAATKSSVTNPFPTISFVGSDATLPAAEYLAAGGYRANATANNWGEAIQVPALIGAVGLGYKPATAGWTENGAAPKSPVGATSLVSLSRNTWCGIMTGAITDWNNAEITADNQGTSITGNVAAPIYVVYRTDGSGTTEIFANALINQCAGSPHPVPNAWQTSGGNVAGQTNDSFYLNLGPGHANILPVGNVGAATAGFIGQAGSGGIHDFINATPGAVGYLSTDFLQPIDSSGPKAINLQSWASVGKPKKVFIQPNAKSATQIMQKSTPPSNAAGSCATNTSYAVGSSPDGVCSHNPINWGVMNPLPTSAAAYPIGGFTFLEMYTCYNPAGDTDFDALIGQATLASKKSGYIHYYYVKGAGKVNKSLAKNGFGKLPPTWLTAAKALLFTDPKTKPARIGDAGTACAGFANGGA